MVYTRIVQPGQKRQYSYQAGESLLRRISGTVIPQAWWMCLLTMVTTFIVCFLYDPLRRRAKTEDLTSWEKLWLNIFADVERTMNYLTGFVTFILGFFNSTVFYRWWSMRSLCAKVVEACQNTAMQVVVFFDRVPPDSAGFASPKERLKVAREELVRMLSLAQALALQACHRERDLKRLVDNGLLKDGSEEHQALANIKGPRYNEAWAWFIHQAYTYADEGMIDPKVAASVTYMFRWSLCHASNHVEDLMMHINQPVPLAYCHLLELLVTVYVLISPVALVPKLLWVAILISPIVSLFFYGFFRLGSSMLMDPFQQDSGFDSDALLKSAIHTMRSLEQTVPVQSRELMLASLVAEQGPEAENLMQPPARRRH